MSSAGRRVELIRSLRSSFGVERAKIIALDSNPFVPSRYVADQFFVVPPVASPDFKSALCAIVTQYGANFLVPTIDTELPFYAKLRAEKIMPGLDVLVSSPDLVALAQDKLAFAVFVEGIDLPAIETQSLDRGLAGWEQFPAFLKPRRGSSSVGSRVVLSEADVVSSDFKSDYLIQPLREGPEYTIDFAVSQAGKLLGYSIRERFKVNGGEVVSSVTREISPVADLLQRFVDKSAGLYGVMNLQVVFYEGDYLLLELNARVGGGYPLTHLAGCDLFNAVVSGDESEMARTREGFLMLRYHDAIVIPPSEG